MSFVRPEAAAALLRWRETLLGAGLAALGAWWAFRFIGLLPYLGYGLIALGCALIFVGLQRARFRVPVQGPGVVSVIEEQIAYFGPLSGGMVALSDLTRISVDTRGKPAHWILSQPMQPDIHIPATAKGAEALFDAFSRLPGLRTEFMLTTLSSRNPRCTVIWQGREQIPLARLEQ